MGGLAHGGLQFEEDHEALERDGKRRQVNADAAELLERRVESHECADEDDEVGEGILGPKGVEQHRADAEKVERLHNRVEHFAALHALHIIVGGLLAPFVEGLRVNFLQRVGLGDANILERFDRDVSLADAGRKILAPERLDFPGDHAGWDDAKRREGERNEAEFPIDDEHRDEQKEIVLGSLMRSERPSLTKL